MGTNYSFIENGTILDILVSEKNIQVYSDFATQRFIQGAETKAIDKSYTQRIGILFKNIVWHIVIFPFKSSKR